VNRLSRANLAINFPQNVEQPRVHLCWLVYSPIAQQPVELLQRLLVIAPISTKGDRCPLIRVRVEECQTSSLAIGLSVLSSVRGDEGNSCRRAEDDQSPPSESRVAKTPTISQDTPPSTLTTPFGCSHRPLRFSGRTMAKIQRKHCPAVCPHRHKSQVTASRLHFLHSLRSSCLKLAEGTAWACSSEGESVTPQLEVRL
jgi:hypothetical protein